MRLSGRPQALWLLLAATVWPGAAAAQDEWSGSLAYLAPCETTRIDAGAPEARWALLDGVYENERDRRGVTHVWTARDWQARLLLTSPGARTLRLTGRRGPPQLTLRASWNGVDLGAVEVGKGRASLTWEVPAESIRDGLNLLSFRASAARERERHLSFRLERLDLEPSGADCGPVETATASSSFTLPPGALLLAQTRLPPSAVLELELTGEGGTTTELLLSRGGSAPRRIDLTTGDGRQVERLGLGDLVSNELVLVNRGAQPATVRLLEITGDERSAAWRAACGLLWRELPALAALLGLLALAIAAGRRWPGGRAALALDCALIMGLALALRFLYLDAYPAMEPRRFGDSWEYLQRSRYLLHGASFWSDTSWHAWITWIRPPGYYLILATVLGPLGGGLALLGQLQAVLLAATAVCAYLTAYPLFGRSAALVAGLLTALYPQTITSASWILSDPPALFLTSAGLACLSWLAARPRWPLALATGALFGVACLVRSAPLYFVPLAALLLWIGQRPPRRKAPALALAGAALLVVLPWCVRNSRIYGKPMGIDDMVIPNFLMAHPDPELLPEELDEVGVWGESGGEREEYFRALWRGNKRAWMTRDSGRILGRGLLRMAASPATTLRRFGLHLKIYFQGFPPTYSAHFLGERDGCRVTAWTDALNLIYLLTLLPALAGILLALRRREAWPLLAWVLYFTLVTNLFFYPSYMPGRYRLPIYPALAALAGLALARAGELAADRFSRRRAGVSGA